MDTVFEDHLGRLIKVDNFLLDNAASFSNPDVAAERTTIHANIEAMFQFDSIASRPLEGFTLFKKIKKDLLKSSILLVRAGAVGYLRKNPDPGKWLIVNFPDSKVDQISDKELYTLADMVHDVANPIKLLMGPYNVTGGDVDALPTKSAAYLAVIELPSKEEDISKQARIDRNALMDTTNNVNIVNLESYLLNLSQTNSSLYGRWLSALAIDDSGGGSGSEGYELLTLTIPANSSMSWGAVPPPDKFFYTRQIGGNLGCIACVKPAEIDVCTTGFTMEPGITVKKLLTEYPLTGSGFIIFTNPNSETVTVRAGVKTS